MRLLSEWIKKTGLDFDSVLGGYRYTVFSNEAICVEGCKNLVSVASDSILLRTGRGILEIGGSDLRIAELSDGELVVTGKGISVAERGTLA